MAFENDSDDLKENLEDFFSSLEMGGEKHLLVEGTSDKQALEKLFTYLTYFSHKITIHLAENLDVSSQRGNRGKVEYTCKAAYTDSNLKSQSIILAGFIDREFEKFDLNELRDLLEGHYVEENLVWSRGHSIENYLFNPLLFKELFCLIFDVKWAHEIIQKSEIAQVLQEFEVLFQEILSFACAIGLAAYELRLLNLVEENIVRQENISLGILEIKDRKLSIDFDKWKNQLIQRGIANSELVYLPQKYIYYRNKLMSVDSMTVKRLCHGHLGFDLILFIFCCCLKEIATLEQKALDSLVGRIRGLTSKGGSAFEQCAVEWSRQVKQQKCEYPRELFLLLGIFNEGVGCLPEDSSVDIKPC